MNKKLGFIISGVMVILILGFGVFYSSTSQAEASLSTEDIKNMVKEQYPGEITEIEQETEFNRMVYEVEIKTDDTEYDLKLDGKTGEVLNLSEKPIKNKGKVNNEKKNDTTEEKKDEQSNNDQKTAEIKQKQTSKGNENETKKAIISIDEAKKIALEAFTGKIDDIELDEEDGRLIYEVEIERGDKEAELEIDAYTGEIIVMEIDED